MVVFKRVLLAGLFLFVYPELGGAETKMFFNNSSHLSHHQKFFRSEEVPEQFSSIGVEAEDQGRWALGRWDFSGEAFLSVAEEQMLINPRELSTQTGNLTLGRHREHWSHEDRLWRRGLWQPRFFWDKFQSEQQGLTGAFARWDWDRDHFLVFASPLFIPEFGPQHRLVGGRFESANPWFRPPIDRLDLLGVESEVFYSVETPPISQIALNPSLALKGHKEWGAFYADVAVARKPMNQLMLAAPFYLDLTAEDERDAGIPAEVTVHPRVVYHNLAMVAAGVREGRWHLRAGATQEEPDDFDQPSKDWLVQRGHSTTIADLYLGYEPAGPFKDNYYLAYSQIWGGDAYVENQLTRKSYIFEGRYQFHRAVKAGWNHNRWNVGGLPLVTGTEVIYDFAQRGMAFAAELSAIWKGQWRFSLRSEFLGIVDEAQAEVDNGFLRSYRTNDRLNFEVQYVF